MTTHGNPSPHLQRVGAQVPAGGVGLVDPYDKSCGRGAPPEPQRPWRSDLEPSFRRLLGSATLRAYRLGRRAYSKGFSLAVAGSFASFGRGSVLEPPIRIGGEWQIALGENVFVGASSWLQTHPGSQPIALEIGSGTSIAGNCVLSAACSIRLAERVLIARGVYISDHIHAYDDIDRAVLDQGFTRLAPVEICEGAWLGENVVVGPGVRVGRGAVIGASAVVLEDVPDFSVAVGAPARVVRVFGESDGKTERASVAK
jgi:carbonic anhydrase/acetyltransferase-like protein (isoleucine patch superfamily)